MSSIQLPPGTLSAELQALHDSLVAELDAIEQARNQLATRQQKLDSVDEKKATQKDFAEAAKLGALGVEIDQREIAWIERFVELWPDTYRRERIRAIEDAQQSHAEIEADRQAYIYAGGWKPHLDGTGPNFVHLIVISHPDVVAARSLTESYRQSEINIDTAGAKVRIDELRSKIRQKLKPSLVG